MIRKDAFPEDIQGEDEEEELYEHFRLQVDKGQSILRIDQFLKLRLEHTSRNRIQNAAKAGAILVNGKPVKQNYKVKPQDVISIVLAKPPRDKDLKAENIPLDIVYEDDYLLVVNKPAGMVVHPGVGNFSGTLVNALMWHFENLPMPAGRTEYPRPGLVHRIDKNTSGLLVIAKDEESMTHLAKQFFDRTTERLYTALVWGNVESDNGRVEGNIGRDERFRKLMTVFPEGDAGKPAVTNYKVIERLGYVTLTQCKLETGRTHQIRVHMKYIGHTLFNDDRYDGNRILKGPRHSKYISFVENCLELIPGQALHAQTLGFRHPVTGNQMYFESPLPDGFERLLERWRTYSAAVKTEL